MENVVAKIQERAQLIAEKAQNVDVGAESLPLGLRVGFALNETVAAYQGQGGYGLGDPNADDAEELLEKLWTDGWESMTEREVQLLAEVFYSFMMDESVCPPDNLDFLVPAWVGAKNFMQPRERQTAAAARAAPV